MTNTITPPTVLQTPDGSTGSEVRQLMSDSNSDSLRVALYPRVSGDKQVREGYGLDYQESDLRQCAKSRNYAVIEVVREPAFSRTEFNRPGLDRLRELAQDDKIDAVLAWKRDRYFGDPGLRAMFEYEMDSYGVRFLAMDDAEGERLEDKFADGIKDLLAQLEVR